MMKALLATIAFQVFLWEEAASFGLSGCECKDYYGSCRADRQEWVDDNTWQYRCDNGELLFLGCVASERGGAQLVPVGLTETINGFWHTCGATKTKLKYEQEPHCSYAGKELHVGETYRVGEEVFERICQTWGIGITGCFYRDEVGDEKFLAVGQKAEVGLIVHHCSELSSMPGRIQYWTSVKKGVQIITPVGKGESQLPPTPSDVINYLPAPPLPWLHVHASKFIQMDGFFRAKVRYLD